MKEDEKPSWLRRAFDFLRWGAFAALAVWSHVQFERTPRWIGLLYIPLLIYLVIDVARVLRSDRNAKAVRSGDDKWILGEPYAIEIDPRCNGARLWGQLTLGDADLSWTHPSGTYGRAIHSQAMPLTAVQAIRVKASWIEIDSGTTRFRVVPRSYADRERLLWELAVRCNAAMERGLDEVGASREVVPAPPPARSLEDAPTVRVTTAPDAPGLTSLDRGMSGLGSALAGPGSGANPAPPRRSGLGVGLFVPPPGRSDDGDS